MTDEQMRVKIAEACGWRKIEVSGPLKSLVGWIPDTENFGYIHDYPNDLNACHEMEKVLDVNISSADSNRYKYSRILYDLVAQQDHGDRQPFRATARQRCEAFLRTIGQWEEQ